PGSAQHIVSAQSIALKGVVAARTKALSPVAQLFQRMLNPKQYSEEEEHKESIYDDGQPRIKQRDLPRYVVAARPRRNNHALAVEALDQGGIVWGVGPEAAAVGKGAVNLWSLDQHVAHTTLI